VESKTVDVSVQKIWDDDDNAYGTRPESLKVTLSNGETFKLNEANGWSATAEGLPAEDAEGNAIRYSWTEETPTDYTLVDTAVIGNTTVLTNRYRPILTPPEPEPVPEEPETVSTGVKKVWDDDNNEYRMRPGSVTVILNNTGDAYALNAANNWSVTVDGLPMLDADGNEITYTWSEQNVPNYTLTDTSVIGNITVFTNRYRPAPTPPEVPTTSASILKIWDDEENAAGARPANVNVTLSNGQTYTLNEGNGWSVTVDGLPATDADGNDITYSWTEQAVPGYTMVGNKVVGNTTVLTNRINPTEEPEEDVPTTSATVMKIWDDDDNKYGRRPSHLRVTLSNGHSYDLNAGNGWSVTVDGLPATVNGQEIVYTWSEQSVPGYKQVGVAQSGNTTVFTNRYRVPEKPMVYLDTYETPLGVGVTINHVGDCFE